MRFLNTENGDAKEFVGDEVPSEYAVLSHRWGGEEVSYQDWLRRASCPEVRSRHGYRKIQAFCNLAKANGMEWAWIDTCCIDKTSSQELSEAINSMFNWYRNCSVCYALLEDYDSNSFNAASLGKCELFLRGWTLQELIAPVKVDFYNGAWKYIGSKTDPDVCKAVSDITKIDVEFLCGSDLEYASIAKRMSWASKRKTTRPEDMAYCLLGIFDINMPLLYGEGTKAFKRLQEEILRAYPDDQSLYAWGTPVEECSIEVHVFKASSKEISEGLQNNNASAEPLYGLLANSPKDFEFSRNILPVRWASEFYTRAPTSSRMPIRPVVVGKGISASFDVPAGLRPHFYYQTSERTVSQIRHGYYALLLCQDGTNEYSSICLPMLYWGAGFFGRLREFCIDTNGRFPRREQKGSIRRCDFHVIPEKKYTIKPGDIVMRSVLNFRDGTPHSYKINRRHRAYADSDEVIRVMPNSSGIFYNASLQTDAAGPANWAVQLGRVHIDGQTLPAFQGGIVRYIASPDPFTDDFLSHKVFKVPSDEVQFSINSHTAVTIRVERHWLRNNDDYIDVVDLALKPLWSDMNIPIVEMLDYQLVE